MRNHDRRSRCQEIVNRLIFTHIFPHFLNSTRRRCRDRELRTLHSTPPRTTPPDISPMNARQACSKWIWLSCLHLCSSFFRSFSLLLSACSWQFLQRAQQASHGSSGLCWDLLYELLHASLLLVVPSIVVPCFFTHGFIQEVPSVRTLAVHRACFSTEPWEVSPQAGSATAYAFSDAVFVKSTSDMHLSISIPASSPVQ